MSKGEKVKWNPWRETFTDIGDWIGLNPPKEKVSYTLDFIESKPEWFKGIGEQRDYYPSFPSKKAFYEEDNGCGYYYVSLESRHNNMCRFCQVMGKVEFRKEAQEVVYELAKNKYEEFVKKQS